MSRTTFGILASVLVLMGCNTAKNRVIPSDPKQWDQIAKAAKSLSEPDQKTLTSYMMRMIVFSGGGGIPPGTTIGDAIKQEKEFEDRQEAEEAKANLLKAQVAAQRAADAAKIRQVATLAVINTTVSPQNIMAGRFQTRLNLDIAVENKTEKTITGIKGTIDFKDQFDSDIAEVNLSLAEDVKPGQTKTFRDYGKDLNQFEKPDQKLASTPFSKMKVTFVPQMIVFGDGSKVGSPDKED